jgi:hypothetical protein
MNSTSARERGGNLAFVDGGRVLVGWPGAPGWTTTGARELGCCAGDGAGKKTAKAASKLENRAEHLAGRTSRRCSLIRFGCGFGAKLNLAY